MYFVFEQLTVNLLSVNLWYISCNVALAQRHISFTDFPEITNVASSAYKTDFTPQSRNTSYISAITTVLVLSPWVLHALLIEAKSNYCLDKQFVFYHTNNCKTNCLLGRENHTYQVWKAIFCGLKSQMLWSYQKI